MIFGINKCQLFISLVWTYTPHTLRSQQFIVRFAQLTSGYGSPKIWWPICTERWSDLYCLRSTCARLFTARAARNKSQNNGDFGERCGGGSCFRCATGHALNASGVPILSVLFSWTVRFKKLLRDLRLCFGI